MALWNREDVNCLFLRIWRVNTTKKSWSSRVLDLFIDTCLLGIPLWIWMGMGWVLTRSCSIPAFDTCNDTSPPHHCGQSQLQGLGTRSGLHPDVHEHMSVQVIRNFPESSFTLYANGMNYVRTTYVRMHTHKSLQVYKYTTTQGHKYTSTTLHYITLHYTTLHYIGLDYITLHCIYITLHYTTLD